MSRPGTPERGPSRPLDEADLIRAWSVARNHIVISQIAPTLLLAASVLLFVLGVAEQPLPVRLALAGILLASGVLGAVVQFAAASEALAVVASLTALPAATPVGRTIAGLGWTMMVVRVVTPVIFVAIFAAELWALFLPR